MINFLFVFLSLLISFDVNQNLLVRAIKNVSSPKSVFCLRVLNLFQRLNTLTKRLLMRNLKLTAESLG